MSTLNPAKWELKPARNGVTAADEVQREMIMATKEQKAMALRRLNEIGQLGSTYMARAKELITNPALLNQDQFGICGMAASTYILLVYDPLRFVDLLCSIFNNEEFEGIPVGIKDPVTQTGDLLEHRIEQYQRKLAQKPDLDPKSKLDFLVCRSLGKLLKKTDKQTYTETKDFSKKFAPSLKLDKKDEDKILKKGDLALTGEAVEVILKEIVQAPVIESHNKGKMDLLAGPAIVGIINDWFDKHPMREPLVVAAVNRGHYMGIDPKTHASVPVESLQWIQGYDPPSSAFPHRLSSEPDYDHWVLITGKVSTKITSGGNEYAIPVWTWGKYFTARLLQNYTQGYIGWLLCVALDPAKTTMPLVVPRASPDWIADETTKTCSRSGCNATIGKGSRHHCRLCGKLFCADCCPELEMVPGQQLKPDLARKVGEKFSPIPGPVRVCSDCFKKHAGFHWMRDKEATQCQECHKEFGSFRWRHHCRYCGKLVCGDCSAQNKACRRIGYIDPVRICKSCLKTDKWK